MPTWKSKEVQNIEKMINHGEFTKANEEILRLEQKKNLTPETIIGLQLFKAKLSISQNWSESLVIIEKVIEELKGLDKPLLLNEALISKVVIFRSIQKNEDAITILNEAEEYLNKKLAKEDIQYKIGFSHLLFQKGACYNFIGELDQANKVLKQSVTLLKSLDEKNLLYNVYEQLGITSFFKADYNNAIKRFKKILKLGQENKNTYQIYSAYISLAQAYQRIGKFEQSKENIEQSIEIGNQIGQSIIGPKYILALDYYSMGEIKKAHALFREVLPFYEDSPNPRAKSLALWMKSSFEWYSGSIEKTIEYLTEAVDILETQKDRYLGTLLALYLASAYNDKGEYDKALELSIKNFKRFEEYNNTWFNSYYYDLLGKIYHSKGNYELALENTKMSFKLRRELNSYRGMVQSSFYLISIAIDKNDIILYNQFLEELKEIVESHPNPFHDYIYQTSQALILKASNRPRDWMKAIEILEDIIDEDYEDKKFAIIALNNLCELLMIEFSISGDESVLKELEDHIERLKEIAKYQNNFALKLEATNVQILTFWLKAQFSMVDLDIQKARSLLLETRELAGEEGLYRLVEKMNQQQERLLGQVTKWDDFIRKYFEFINE
ncbi:MAG: hypothetical protein EAX90_03530 [Candidatus Heimdallarchaeota archaeon]|nr:hypothetical protein [Candidatus Heimdallarchaeota archaeon]